MKEQAHVRRLFVYLSVGYALFIMYGSLVPFEYQAMSFSTAFDVFMAKEIGFGSSADWAANVLLGIPLAYFLAGVFWRHPRVFAHVLVPLFILVFCYFLSWTIEFLQMFFSSRTPSKGDVLAQNIGAVIGLWLWWLTGSSMVRWLQKWSTARDVPMLSDQILKGYLVILLLYNILPLDLTISPVEIYHQWVEGRVIFVPFSKSFADASTFLYEWGVDVLIWVPVALLLVLSGKRSMRTAWLITVACAVGIEVLQLFVYSRVTDSTDVITAATGAVFGVWVGNWFVARDAVMASIAEPLENGNGKCFLWVGLCVCIWCVVLGAVFWYPYELLADKKSIIEKVKHMQWVPFATYYMSTVFRAITEVFHKVLFFMPLGVAWSFVLIRLAGWPRVGFWIGVILIALVAFGIESGQLFVVGKYPDITDWALETLGGILSLVLSMKIHRRLRQRRNATGQRVEPAGG